MLRRFSTDCTDVHGRSRRTAGEVVKDHSCSTATSLWTRQNLATGDVVSAVVRGGDEVVRLVRQWEGERGRQLPATTLFFERAHHFTTFTTARGACGAAR